MLKAVEKIVALAEEKNITFPEAVLLLDSKESGISVEEIRARMSERLADMRRSVREACAKLVKVSETVKPEPELTAKYEKRYQAFRQIYPALKGVFPALS